MKENETDVGYSRDFDEYERKKETMTWFTWAVIGVMLTVTLTLPVIISVLELDEDFYYPFVFIPAVAIGVMVVLIVVIYPYFKGTRMPDVPDLVDEMDRVRLSKIDLSRGYETVVESPVIIGAGLLGAFTVLSSSLYMAVTEGGMESISTFLLFAVVFPIVILMGKMELRCDPSELKIKNGPYRKSIKLAEVTSIRPVSIEPLKEFRGYGLRMASDGAQGIILTGKVGVRIHMKDEKQLVVTVPNPQPLVDYVRAARLKIEENEERYPASQSQS